MPTYTNIVFMQDEEGRGVVDRLERVEGVVAYGATDETIAAAIAHLAQWDYDDNDNVSDDHPSVSAGTHDHVAGRELDGTTYILVWNGGLGYVGLYRQNG